ncbi:WXG100 family type VII secretion target [Actinacidiphila rubida]|uniref:WXG100 family type VII secretion target n=1 Tax=Actinacidiphila rubida TaxID=310780 RepID=A0A1H8RZM1_9ACTN|nr:WXG100 family type VII secretion target [Actinacidiphila rubida]SEO71578.1 WXG100 family type VII secretion target [Actinacidiphila rubida]
MTAIDNMPISVQTELESAPGTIEARAETIMGELKALQNRILAMPETWIAQSSTEFQDRMREWDASATGLFGTRGDGGVLGDIANRLQTIWENYVEAEGANTKTWASR